MMLAKICGPKYVPFQLCNNPSSHLETEDGEGMQGRSDGDESYKDGMVIVCPEDIGLHSSNCLDLKYPI